MSASEEIKGTSELGGVGTTEAHPGPHDRPRAGLPRARTITPTSPRSSCSSIWAPLSPGHPTRSKASPTRCSRSFPGVGEHSCSRGHAGGFRERLLEGTWAGHVAEHIAIELQRESGAQIYRGKTRGAGRARPLQRDLRVLGGAGWTRGRADRRPARQSSGRSGPGLRSPERA